MSRGAAEEATADLDTVVVGVDGSPEALVAARYALVQAARRRLDVLLVYGYPMPPMDGSVTGVVVDGLLEAGRTVLADAVAALDVPEGVAVRTEVAETLPAVLMQRLSQSARLMVVGQHATAWYDRLGRGAVASPLAHHSGCPVVVVPPSWRQGRRDRLPVVVALDGETASHAALELAFEEAALLGSGVVALHAVTGGGPGEAESADREVAALLAGVRAEHPGTTARVWTVRGDPQRVILSAARDASLLVVGPPHAEGPVAWTRSVARRVMSSVDCPLVVVPGRRRRLQGPERTTPRLQESRSR
jgi:nucleotide-binding universal stress UspA family protein